MMRLKERRNQKGKKDVPSPRGVCRKLIKLLKKNKKKVIQLIHIFIAFGILVTVLAIIEVIKTGDYSRIIYPKTTTIVVEKIEPIGKPAEVVIVPETKEEQPIKEEVVEVKQEIEEKATQTEVSNNSWNYRLTSYYTGDADGSSAVTASGKTTDEFQINEHGWYTYQGKLVIATASDRLKSWSSYANSTARTFDLYQTLILEIDGVKYEAIVLDVCGAAMKRDIIDLFVSNRSSIKDTQIQVYLP